jgi:hypothetical protein
MKKSTKNLLLFALLVVLLLWFMRAAQKSSYSLSPQDVEIVGPSKEPGEMFNLPYKMECTPGPEKESSPYTMGLAPGGLCGAQEFVAGQANYKFK